MPRYRTQVAHSFGQREAVGRLKALTERARSFSDLDGTWDENRFTFTVTAQGVGLRGTLEVEEDALKFDGKLPLIAMPFTGWIAPLLKKGLEQTVLFGEEAAASVEPEEVANARAVDADRDAPVVLFLHIPKAGGQTLGEFVYNQCRAEESGEDALLKAGVAYLTYGFLKEPDLSVPAHVRSLLQRRDLRAVIGHFWFGLHEHVARPSNYITLLRNPLERVVSLYYYAKLSETMSMEEFVTSPPFKEVDNDQTRRIAGDDPEIGGCTSETLRKAKENLRKHFAVVGLTERFDETLVLLKRRLGWTREVLSYPRNVNPHRMPTASLPQAVVDAARRRNELDFELWQYASALMDEAIAAEGEAFRSELERYRSLRASQTDASEAD
ncbi:MAG TPA: polyhydroxyalkanoic acid system family protein [Pyrinomonadaceae bacterium]|jgi:hypothetical protein